MQCNATQRNATQRNTSQYTASHRIQHNTAQHSTTQHNTTQHNTTQHSTTQRTTTVLKRVALQGGWAHEIYGSPDVQGRLITKKCGESDGRNRQSVTLITKQADNTPSTAHNESQFVTMEPWRSAQSDAGIRSQPRLSSSSAPSSPEQTQVLSPRRSLPSPEKTRSLSQQSSSPDTFWPLLCASRTSSRHRP
eukprot:1832477-Rhodomonas_salina.1